MKNYLYILVIFFCSTYSVLNAQKKFEDNVITNNHNYGSSISGSHAADIDGDGDLDVIAYYYEGNLVWYENKPNKGGLVEPKVIYKSNNGSNSNLFAVDIDKDGDLDIFASDSNGKVFWHENLDGLGNFEKKHLITEDSESVSSLDYYDIDGDGDYDVLISFNSFDYKYQTAWYENKNGKGDFGVKQTITTIDSYGSSFVEDIDLDGDGDVIIGSKFWFENIDGKGTFTQKHKITNEREVSNNGFPIDIDNDGDIDVLVAEGYYDRLLWYENTDGLGTFGAKKIIGNISGDISAVFADDIDGDNDIDILIDGDGLYYFINDGEEKFTGRKNIYKIGSNSNNGVIIAADIDGDGDKDVISSCVTNQKSGMAYSEYDQSTGEFKAEYILSEYFSNPIGSFPVDIDNDGDLDILVASNGDNRISWFEDVNGKQKFSIRHIISTTVYSPKFVIAEDIDNDGDMDVFAVSESGNKIVWFKNQGNGVFGDEIVLTADVKSPQMVAITDIDKDGNLDVVSVSRRDDKIAWYKNLDGLGNFGEQQIISTESDEPLCIYTADFDNDGDNDLFIKSINDRQISWYKNEDGKGNFSAKQVISYGVSGTNPNFDIDDIDNDGDLDILTPSDDDSDLAWYENIGGDRQFSYSKRISYSSTKYCELADMDLDGDLDVVFEYGPNNNIKWYENLDGKGDFQTYGTTISSVPGDNWTTNSITNFFVKDMDFDGDIDVVSIKRREDKLIYTENLKVNTLSVHGYSIHNFSVHPNPSRNIVNVKNKNVFNTITIYGVSGRVLKNIELKKPKLTHQLNVSNLSPGVYFIEIKSNKKKEIVKFLKE